jgi:hypothetical protein
VRPERKSRGTIFPTRVGRYRCHKNCDGTHYIELVFLHLVGSVGHVVHSGTSEERNVNALYFLLGEGDLVQLL